MSGRWRFHFPSRTGPPDHQSGLAFEGSKVTLSWIAAAPLLVPWDILPHRADSPIATGTKGFEATIFEQWSLLPIASTVVSVTIIYGVLPTWSVK